MKEKQLTKESGQGDNGLRDNCIVSGKIQSRCLGSVREWIIEKSNSNPSQITL